MEKLPKRSSLGLKKYRSARGSNDGRTIHRAFIGVFSERRESLSRPIDVRIKAFDHFQGYAVDKKKSTKLAFKPVVDLEDQFGLKNDVVVDDRPDLCFTPAMAARRNSIAL